MLHQRKVFAQLEQHSYWNKKFEKKNGNSLKLISLDLRLIDKCYMNFDGDEQSKGQKWNDVWRRLDIQNSETSQHEANESLLTLNNKWDYISRRKVGWLVSKYLRWKIC